MTTAQEQKPFLAILTLLGFQINSAIEEGHGDKVSFNDIYTGLEKRTLFEILQDKLPGALDLGLFRSGDDNRYIEQREGIINALASAASGMKGSEEKYGVRSSGLSLMMAYILEAIQQEYWTPLSRR